MLLEAKSRVHGSHQRRRRTASGGGPTPPDPLAPFGPDLIEAWIDPGTYFTSGGSGKWAGAALGYELAVAGAGAATIAVNGANQIALNGTSQVLQNLYGSAGNILKGRGSCTIVMVFNPGPLADRDVPFNWDSSGDGGDGQQYVYNETDSDTGSMLAYIARSFGGSDFVDISTPYGDMEEGTPVLYAVRLPQGGTPVGNLGVSQASGSGPNANVVFDATGNYQVCIGGYDSSSFLMNLKVSVFAVINKVLSDAELETLADALSDNAVYGTAGVQLWV